MKSLMQRIGILIFFLAWPAYQIYFRRNDRTRVLLFDGNELLVLKGWVSDGTWNLAGGGLHSGEKPLAGALRETQEEIGLQLTPTALTSLGEAEFRRYGLHFRYHAFAAYVDKAALPLRRQRHEIADIRWLPITQLTPRNASQEVFRCLEMARSRKLLLQ